jgi:putative transposase
VKQIHWTRIYSTNPLERLNKEIKRRTNVVGEFTDQPPVVRLAGLILMGIDDEWQAAERHYFSLVTMRELTHPEMLLEDLGPLRLAPIH